MFPSWRAHLQADRRAGKAIVMHHTSVTRRKHQLAEVCFTGGPPIAPSIPVSPYVCFCGANLSWTGRGMIPDKQHARDIVRALDVRQPGAGEQHGITQRGTVWDHMAPRALTWSEQRGARQWCAHSSRARMAQLCGTVLQQKGGGLFWRVRWFRWLCGSQG